GSAATKRSTAPVSHLRLIPQPPSRSSSDVECLDAFQKELNYIHRTFLRLGTAPSEVEDLVQELFLVLRRLWHDYDAERPLRPYLFGIAFRIASSHQRKYAREVKFGVVKVADPRPGPDDVLESNRARSSWKPSSRFRFRDEPCSCCTSSIKSRSPAWHRCCRFRSSPSTRGYGRGAGSSTEPFAASSEGGTPDDPTPRGIVARLDLASRAGATDRRRSAKRPRSHVVAGRGRSTRTGMRGRAPPRNEQPSAYSLGLRRRPGLSGRGGGRRRRVRDRGPSTPDRDDGRAASADRVPRRRSEPGDRSNGAGSNARSARN